tara:strand:+ start:356 stop:685 length:330 start_codon:yes stop_codon:yes gene_type:complete
MITGYSEIGFTLADFFFNPDSEDQSQQKRKSNFPWRTRWSSLLSRYTIQERAKDHNIHWLCIWRPCSPVCGNDDGGDDVPPFHAFSHLSSNGGDAFGGRGVPFVLSYII